MNNLVLERITINHDICYGKPCIRGLRYPVEMILKLLSSGMTIDDILEDYDDLEYKDILAVLNFDLLAFPINNKFSHILEKLETI
ncbi:MAG: DUF433 domain-containing protein [Dolichospermum sp. JUN01]|nr:DUF433 domain-containing protein [Dolichospermum sp. JUN01]MBS9391852.1 DUF433 domain-containing protein [Dolichospermum sp. OL01]MCO5795498.1 DUF433 domain-containing protein [Dolichospermum sp. OL03]MCS6283062.1 DUF433 domain-containing protein [Dolichospermum sp.]QSV57201.1 MAG: DUF433 domain-containing protein [Dolichospermum sp. LBC05a]